MSNFFPSTDDEPRPVGTYFKTRENGQYCFRILAPFFVYDLAWLDNKPVRRVINQKWVEGQDYDLKGKFPKPPQRAWWTVVRNHWFRPDIGSGKLGLAQNVDKAQGWEIPQASIRMKLEAFGNNPDFGDPRLYDILLTRFIDNKGMVAYELDKRLPSPLSDDAVQEWDAMNVFGDYDPERLLSGGDPFKKV